MSDNSEASLTSYKIVIIGDSGVGKTNMISRFTRNQFLYAQTSTIGMEFSAKVIEIDAQKIKVQLWDTAGQERYRALASLFYKNSAGAFLVFDLTNRPTFLGLHNWITQIKNHTSAELIITLIGNKSDLKDRAVTTQEGLIFAKQYKMAYLQTSASQGQNVENAFLLLLKLIHQTHKKTSTQKKVQPPEKTSLILAHTQEKKPRRLCC